MSVNGISSFYYCLKAGWLYSKPLFICDEKPFVTRRPASWRLSSEKVRC